MGEVTLQLTTLAPPQSSRESYADVVMTFPDDMSEPYMLSGRRRDAGVRVLLDGKLEEKEDMVMKLVQASPGVMATETSACSVGVKVAANVSARGVNGPPNAGVEGYC